MLLDWCTHALTGRYNQKVEFSQNVLEGLWCYLDDLLHSKKLHSLLKQGKTISLRLNMAQVGWQYKAMFAMQQHCYLILFVIVS